MIEMTKEQYSDMLDDNCGMCLICKCESYEVEPDGREYECGECGSYSVYGLEELLLMGKLVFVDEGEEDA